MILYYQYILIWSLTLSFIISLVYRLFTKPHEMRQIKADMKLYRQKSKEAQKNKDMKKANEHMTEMMKLSQKQMKHTMRPMIITLGIVMILLGFVNSSYSGITVQTTQAGQDFATGYFAYDDFNHSVKVQQADEGGLTVAIDANDNGNFADDEVYSSGDIAEAGGAYWAVTPQNLNQTSMQTAVMLPFPLPFLGSYLTWLFWYILVSLPATWIFRKALGVE